MTPLAIRCLVGMTVLILAAALASGLADPAGTFWRYGWAAGMPARPRRGGGG